MGLAASMGAFLLAAGAKGKRSALPHSRIMIHQPSGGAQGTAATSRSRRGDPDSREDERAHRQTHGPPLEQIERDIDRDRFMSAEEAKEYGIVDNVVVTAEEIAETSRQPAITL